MNISFIEKNEKKLFFLLLIFVIFILIFNLFTFNPILGYDAEAHHAYIEHIARYLPESLNLPSEDDTYEFFSPPLPYLFPSLVSVICRNVIESENILESCRPYYSKITQIFQTCLYLLTIFINLKSIQKINKSKSFLNLGYFLMISIISVNYRSISMIRGEVYIIFFLSLLLYIFLQLKENKFHHNNLFVLAFGLTVGSLLLSRQWSFFLIPGFIIIAFILKDNERTNYLKLMFKQSIISGSISFWFYLNLFVSTGSFTAFNKEFNGFNFNNQSTSFYIPTTKNIYYFFTKPIRPWLDNQFLTTIYSDLWGDYWGYFVFTSRFLNDGRGQEFIGNYLARVNIISLLSTFLLFYLYFSRSKLYKKNIFLTYIRLTVIISILGYIIFLILYPEIPTGDTIKATYILHFFHLIIFYSALNLESIKKENIKIYNFFIFIFIVTFIHNFSAYLSHYSLEFISRI